MREVVFVAAARTPFCKIGGALKAKAATELGMLALQGLLNRTEITERGQVDTVLAGTANTDKFCRHPARFMTLGVDLPLKTSSSSIEMQEGTGIVAINYAASKIALGFDDVAIAGAVDSWSTKPAYMRMDVAPYELTLPAALVHKNSPYPDEDLDQAAISDRMAKLWGVSREECDDHACESRARYAAASQQDGWGEEIVPFTVPATKKTPELIVTADDGAAQADRDALRACTPIHAGGITTRGNTAGYADGAAFVLMMSAEKAKELGYTPIARWVTGAEVGCEPNVTGIAAAYSSLRALKQAGLTVEDVAVWENNEITAAYDLCVMKEIARKTGKKIPAQCWNRNGGALAIGHPNAATGVRMAYDAMKQLQKGGRYGVISTSCAGGQGASMIIERIDG